MALEGLKGLTAQDRADWEEKYSKQLSGMSTDEIERFYRNTKFKERFGHRSDYDMLKRMSPEERDAFYNKSYTSKTDTTVVSPRRRHLSSEDITTQSDAIKTKAPVKDLLPEEQERIKGRSQAYREIMSSYNTSFANEYRKRDAIKDVKSVAEEISPYYRKYKDTEYLPFNDDDWKNMTIEYKSRKHAYGEDVANKWLQGRIQDTASKNQGIIEKGWRGLAGMGASAAGAIVGTAGMLVGAYNYMSGNHEDVEGLNAFENFVDAVMDNKVTRYGNDITQYGTIFNLEEAKKYGLSDLEIIQTQGQQEGTDSLFDQVFNVNFIPVALQSGGFTAASMFTGAAAAKLTSWMFKGAKALSTVGKTGNTTQKLLQARKVLNSIQKVENFNNKFIIPGLTGTTEGVIEGLGTKLDVLENAKRAAEEAQSEYVDRRFRELMSENPKMNPDEAYQIAWDEFAPKYKEVLEQAEFVSSKAGVNNFLANSFINGVINQTLKAGLQAPNVQGALQKSRLFNWATPKGKFSVTGSGSELSVTPKYGFWKQAWNIGKEPLGEFSEEYLQSVSDDTMSGGAEHNIHKFIENKYNGDGTAEVGSAMAGDFSAALTAMGESMVSTETIVSGIYGAVSSVMGTPVFSGKNYTKQVKGKNGKYHTAIDLSKREGESTLGHITRIMPWRSGLVNAVRENSETKKQLYDDAKELENWLRDPNNRAKFDGVLGTYNWAKQMESDAAGNDEFGYRNSLLGKTINDVIMLEKLKGTAYYDSFMNELVTAANLERGTEQANAFVKAMRDNINTRDDNLSDEDILKQLKDNANKLLNTISTVQQESDKIERTLGNVDEDTKQALIFGQMSMQDWDRRGPKIESELKDVASSIKDSRDASNMSKELNDVISRFGSLKNAKDIKGKLDEAATDIKKDIDNLNNRKATLTDSEKKILKGKRAKLNSISKQLSKLKDVDNISEAAGVLNESQIMALPAAERAIMLNKANLSSYSSEQQEVIKNLIDKGTAKDINFYNKIQDAGRMEIAKQTFLTQYNEILRDPNSFKMYVLRAKQAAADVLTKKRFEAISNISDYKEFAREMDKLIDGGTAREQRLIIKALSGADNQNYKKFKADRELLEGLFNQIVKDDAFKNLDGNDADMFTLSLQYLSNNDVDLNDENAVVEALSKTDNEGNSLLKKYVEEVTADSPEAAKTAFTSIGEAIQTYKNVMQSFKRDEEERANNNKPIEVKSTTPEQSAPPKPVDPKPAVSSTPTATPEETKEAAEKTTDEVPTTANTEQSSGERRTLAEPSNTSSKQEEDPIIAAFLENSNDEVADAARVGLNVIRNTPENYSGNIKEAAEGILTSLSENEFETPNELGEALVKRANQLDISAKEEDKDTKELTGLLRNAGFKIIEYTQEKKRTEEEERNRGEGGTKSTIFNSLRAEARKSRENAPSGGPEVNVNSGILSSLDIENLRKNHPNNPSLKYYDTYGIKQYLQSGKLKIGARGTHVYYITDDVLSQNTKASIEADGGVYTTAKVPIIAVVEDEDGPLTIGNKKYQPIGIMPASDNKYVSGSANVGRIRALLSNQNSGELIRDNNGNIITSTLVSIKAPKPNRAKEGEINYDLQNSEFNTLSTADQATLRSIPTKAAKREHPIYKRMVQKFLSKVKEKRVLNPATKKNEFKYFYIEVSNLKDEPPKEFRIYYNPVLTTKSTKSDSTIGQLLAENKVEELLEANSRFTKANRAFNQLFTTPSSEIHAVVKDGEIVPTEESAVILENLAKDLTRHMNNYLHLPSNWRYTVSITNEGLYSVAMTNGEATIPLTTTAGGQQITSQEKFNFFKNLILDGDKKRTVKRFIGGMVKEYDFIKYQVDEPRGNKTLEDVKGNLATAFTDGILGTSTDTVEYTPHYIEVRSPFTSAGETIKPVEVSNSSNATLSTPLNAPTVTATDQVQTEKAIVDSETGAVLRGEVKDGSNPKLERARAIADKIAEDSGVMQLSSDGSYYINTKTGRKYARVTSIIAADIEAEGRFDPNSPWALASTRIGNGVDEFVRDFFAGKLHDNGELKKEFFTKYPNASPHQWEQFAQELQSLKNHFDINGLTVIPRDVTVAGTLNVTDSGGNIHTIDVAGTVDLLAYDQEGNFYIYDMKTFRGEIDQHKKDKYARQVSLYKKFLENTYGIQIKSLQIIPIQVSYPEPKGFKGSTNEYTETKDNQLAINGTEFRDAKPRLTKLIEVEYKEPNIQYEKLTDVEKAQIAEVERMISEKDATVNQAEPKTTPSTTETKDVKVKEISVAGDNTPIVDPNTGLNMGKVKARKRAKSGNKVNPKPTRLVPSRLAWGVWEGFTTEDGSLNVGETLEDLSEKFTEEQWNQLTDEQMENILKCNGSFSKRVAK